MVYLQELSELRHRRTEGSVPEFAVRNLHLTAHRHRRLPAGKCCILRRSNDDGDRLRVCRRRGIFLFRLAVKTTL